MPSPASTRRLKLIAALLFMLASCVVSSTERRVNSQAYAQAEGRFYEATGKTLAGEFLDFYDTHGGIPLFGYPVTEARVEEDMQGNGHLVQWTERQRLEYHPENRGTQFEVLLGLLGRELTAGYNGPRFQTEGSGARGQGPGSLLPLPTSPRVPPSPQPPAPDPSISSVFSATGHAIAEPFLSYWSANGGIPVFGYPISSLYTDENGLQVQWYERARFEYHPELSEPNRVLLGHLGLETLKQVGSPNYEMQVFDNPAPEGKLEIGLSQGGESEDPGFFDNIRLAGRDLGPGLVRMDNIFNFYGIVQRTSDGKITYRWSDFDRVLDAIRAMGKEPFICLSYMPETMSAGRASRIEAPANYDEWSALITATVTHVNVERKLGVRYWEVWNEPNQGDFWRSSYEEYLRLYDATVEAALKADPTVHIGGPALSSFAADSLEEFMQHEDSLGERGRVDFVSWHSYGQSPAQVASNIRQVRAITAQHTRFNPELIITEFSVLQGGPGDTSANHATDTAQGAIAFLASIESMQRERLDKALLFELKDGIGPKQFWGRWGLLTNNGSAKPAYYAYRAYQSRPPGQLPVAVKNGPMDAEVGLLAYGSPQNATLLLWYTGGLPARIKVSLPHSFAGTAFDVTLFDPYSNNPAKTGDTQLRQAGARDAGDLVMDMQPSSLAILTTR